MERKTLETLSQETNTQWQLPTAVAIVETHLNELTSLPYPACSGSSSPTCQQQHRQVSCLQALCPVAEGKPSPESPDVLFWTRKQLRSWGSWSSTKKWKETQVSNSILLPHNRGEREIHQHWTRDQDIENNLSLADPTYPTWHLMITG